MMRYLNVSSIAAYLLLFVKATSLNLPNRYEPELGNFELDNRNPSIDLYNYEHPNITNVRTIEDDDPDYPYEQLMELVKETKKLLSASNSTKTKQVLKLDPSYYQSYLNNEFSDTNLEFTESEGTAAAAGGAHIFNRYTCLKEIQYRLPKRMQSIDGREHYIINVGREFMQKLNTVRCRSPGKYCGNPTLWPENYAYICDQGFDRIKKLVSVPVGSEINLSVQNVHEFKIPDSCNCKQIRLKDQHSW